MIYQQSTVSIKSKFLKTSPGSWLLFIVHRSENIYTEHKNQCLSYTFTQQWVLEREDTAVDRKDGVASGMLVLHWSYNQK